MTDIPVGGSTGLDHESSAAIDAAARWLAETPPRLRPVPLIPGLQRMFGLTVAQACASCKEAQSIRSRVA